jgi:hypothetical protein
VKRVKVKAVLKKKSETGKIEKILEVNELENLEKIDEYLRK